MWTRKTRTTPLRVEALEGRVALSTKAHAAPASPVVVNLTPQQTGITIAAAEVDPRIGVITIRGTAQAPPSFPPFYPPFFPSFVPGPSPLSISVNVTQPGSRLQSVTGSGSTVVVSQAPGQLVPFTGQLTAANGRFGRGLATLSLSPTSGPFGFGGAEMVVVRLRPARLA